MADIQELCSKYDTSDYLNLLMEFADQVKEGVDRGRSIAPDGSDYDSVLVCGMGGSAIAGDLLSQYFFYKSSVPVKTNRFYRVPAWVDDNTLVIIVSYSGNTEETLNAFKDAYRCDADCVAVTSGGQLGDRVQEHDLPIVPVPDDIPPRAAAAYLFVPLLFLLDNAGLAEAPAENIINNTCNHLKDLADELHPDNTDNAALGIARELEGKIPIVYGSEEVTAVLAKRFKNQLNENAKVFAVYNVFPEMNHNEIMGIDHLEDHPERYAAVLLRDNGEHSRVQKRFEIVSELLEGSVSSLSEINSRGRSLFARFLTLMLHTDFVSYYLALLNRQDPTSIGYINELKERL
ncbi:MAG: bifunctional phosphoglucose/phosphomannose isomerase [bacterium]